MSDSEISLIFGARVRTVRRRELRRFAGLLSGRVAGGRGFTCLITSDDELRRLNLTFRKRDYVTDVLSFPSGASEGPLGDIAIAAGRAAEQAREHGHSLETEIRTLMLHGVLHLLGMDHEKDNGLMARAERRYRRELDLPAGLIERAKTC